MVTVEKNQPASIQNANEPVRDALELSKSRSAVLNPYVQQASFSPTMVSQTHLAFCVTTLPQYRMMMHHRLGESPGLDQNEPTTATTAVILWIFHRPSFALKSNVTAHCALAACRAVRVPMTNLAEILNSRSAARDRTSTLRHCFEQCFLHCFDFFCNGVQTL